MYIQAAEPKLMKMKRANRGNEKGNKMAATTKQGLEPKPNRNIKKNPHLKETIACRANALKHKELVESRKPIDPPITVKRKLLPTTAKRKLHRQRNYVCHTA